MTPLTNVIENIGVNSCYISQPQPDPGSGATDIKSGVRATICLLAPAPLAIHLKEIGVKSSTGHTHTHTTAEHISNTNTERATAQRRLIAKEQLLFVTATATA